MIADRHIYTLPIAKVIYVVLPAGAHEDNFSWSMRARFREAFYHAFPGQDLALLARKKLWAVKRLPDHLPKNTLVFRWHNRFFEGSRYFPHNPYQIGYFIDRNTVEWRSAIVDKAGRDATLDPAHMRFKFTWSPMGLAEADDDPFAETTTYEMAEVLALKKGREWRYVPEKAAPFAVKFACEREAEKRVNAAA